MKWEHLKRLTVYAAVSPFDWGWRWNWFPYCGYVAAVIGPLELAFSWGVDHDE